MISRRPGRLAGAMLSFLLTSGIAWAEGSIWPDGGGPYVGVDLMVGTPSARGDVFRSVFPGASLRYIASRHFELSLDYAFMDIEYYYPETPSGPWVGPVQWSSMPATFSGMKADWIFFHTKHFIAPLAWYVAPLDELGLPLALRLGAGPAVSLIVPNESAVFYPGLSAAYEQFRASFKAYLGLSLRVGLEYRPWSFARVGVEYLFVVNALADFAGELARDPLGYFDKSGNFLVFAGLRI